MKASFLLLTILGVIAVKLVAGKIDRVAVGNVVSDKQQPAIAGKIAGRRKRASGSLVSCGTNTYAKSCGWCPEGSCNGECTLKRSGICVESGCKDDHNWLDSKYGDGTTGCIDLTLDWCNNHGEFSKEAQRACPVSCGRCKECKAANGAKCLFPFSWGGVTYTGCTKVGNDVAWCATSYIPGGTKTNHWASCGTGCPMQG